MKRILLILIVFFITCMVISAQQSRFPTKQEQQDYLSKVQSDTSDYDSQLEEIKSRNSSSGEMHTFLRIKADIDRLDTRITKEINTINASHDRDNRVSSLIISSLENLINQRKAKQEEMEKLLEN